MGRKYLGKLGEALAAKYLAKKGYKIIARNWRCRQGEIDIVAKKAGVFCFVEVKTGEASEGFSPEDHLDEGKQRRLARLAFWYLVKELGRTDLDYQIDLVAVALDAASRRAAIRHYPNTVSDNY